MVRERSDRIGYMLHPSITSYSYDSTIHDHNKYNRSVMLERLKGRAGEQQRTRIRKRDCYQCRICFRATRVGEIDHIIALVNGGTNEDSNLWLLCSLCHRDKTYIDLGYRLKTAIKSNGMPINPSHHWNK